MDRMKKLMLLGAIYALFPVSAAAAAGGDVGYVNMAKAIRETAEGKKAFGEIEAYAKERQAEVNAVVATARAAAAKCNPLAGAAKKTCDASTEKAVADATALAGGYSSAVTKRQQAVEDRMGTRALRILPKIATAHKLSLIQPSDGALYVAAKLDFTTDLVKRYDAGEGKTDEDLAEELREKNAALEREKTAQVKRNAELEAKVAALEKAAGKPTTGKN